MLKRITEKATVRLTKRERLTMRLKKMALWLIKLSYVMVQI